MERQEIQLLIGAWYSEQIPTNHWIKMLQENEELRNAYNKVKLQD